MCCNSLGSSKDMTIINGISGIKRCKNRCCSANTLKPLGNHVTAHSSTYARTHTHIHTYTYTHTHIHIHTRLHTRATTTTTRIKTNLKTQIGGLEVNFEQVSFEGSFERGSKLRVVECSTQTIQNRWASVRKRAFANAYVLTRGNDAAVIWFGS